MITPEKIDAWIREAEERPASAAIVIRYISNRLRDLTERNQVLLADNIGLRSGKKVEEYETRIANLEYQVDLLKRQLGGGEVSLPSAETISLVLYNNLGQVLRLELAAADLKAGPVAQFAQPPIQPGLTPRLLATNTQEELLFVFDSGRTVAMPVSALPAADRQALDWFTATLQEARGSEELAVVAPVARMTLYDYCIQTSRRGYVKKLREDFFEGHLANNYIGTGVKLPADKTCSLTFCNAGDLFVMVSKDGFVQTVDVDKLPLTIEEVIKLGLNDHIITTFCPGQKTSVLLATNNGKTIHRETSWLEPTASFKSRGQASLSARRRESGVEIAGAAPASEAEWALALQSDGQVIAQPLSTVFATGSLSGGPEVEVIGCAVFQPPKPEGQAESAA